VVSVSGERVVKIGKLGKQLRREVQANPKKAVLLGVLAVVALYFWAPLVFRWTGHGSSGATAQVQVTPSPAAVAEVPAAVTKPKTVSAERHKWHELVQWMEADGRTKPAAPLAAACNPFRIPVLRPQVVEQPKPRPKAEPAIAPQSVGLVLSSTIVGPDRRVARISGRTYAEGSSVKAVTKDGGRIAYTLVDIEPRQVLLQRLGVVYELRIQSPKSTGIIELLGSMP
jgi:hypothetical protein